MTAGRPRTEGCGTYGGYQVHRREGTPVCDLCLAANARQGRANYNSPASRAKRAATAILVARHRTEFDVLRREALIRAVKADA